nr:isoaspartyl peptidase/L-asparaginase [uncultured Campylobacter sp.]
MLERGGSAMDAVTAAIMVLEDDPNFNAGKGAVYRRRI